MCPALEVDLNCTQACLSDGERVANLKCCRAGCATVCQMPSGNPGGLHQAGQERVLVRGGSVWFGEGECSQLWGVWLGGRRWKQFSRGPPSRDLGETGHLKRSQRKEGPCTWLDSVL